MRRIRPSFLFTAALSVCAALPALADGAPDYRTGISPYGVATPVPAPIPVPFEEAAWYFRADFAAGFGSQPSVNAFGTPFGSGTAAGTIGLNPAWLSESFEPSFTGGVGVGYVWGPHFRTDLTVDIHSEMNADFVGTTNYVNAGGAQTVFIQDKTRFFSTVLLVNGYYDIRTGTPFSPYIGGGVGFTVDQLTQEIAATDSGTLGSASVGNRSTQVNFAGAAMAGLTYDVNTFISIDVGYRYLYIAGSDVDSVIYNNNSHIEIGSVNEHQIRAGLRFYVN
jgi:opacity protein-like surface antigen